MVQIRARISVLGPKIPIFGVIFHSGIGKIILPKKKLSGVKGYPPSPFFLPPRPAWGGGTQVVKGADLTGGDTRFCRESSKSRGFHDRGSEIQYPAGNKNGRLV